ncbi:MAG: hypothetical protein IPL46_21680 [Saprospiraceae bacterium]|nr:hypothetical protein [Saprospiraceae bacterium]
MIAAILKYKEEGWLAQSKVMVVAPTGLLSNWESEIVKFAPSLKSIIYHGTTRKMEAISDFDVVITSYGTLRSDVMELKKKSWFALVIDEAQNIKNISTEQTKAVKSIKAENFIAMSGTQLKTGSVSYGVLLTIVIEVCWVASRNLPKTMEILSSDITIWKRPVN